MVRILQFAILCFYCTSGAFADSGSISVFLESDKTSPGFPIEGSITLIRENVANIQTVSASIEGRDLELQETNIAENTSVLGSKQSGSSKNAIGIKTWKFVLPAAQSGFHKLPPLTLQVDDSTYRSPTITYFVPKRKRDSSFFIERIAKGTEEVYPGQTVLLGYKIYYQREVELTKQYLPLLDSDSLEKIGDQEVQHYVEGKFNVQEIVQRYRVKRPGPVSFDESLLDGQQYKTLSSKRRVLEGAVLQATCPPFEFLVYPFPEKGKPTHFTGLIGEYRLCVHLNAPTEVRVGDLMTLEITLEGEGVESTIQLPNFENMPKFTSDFRFSDLTEQVKKGEQVLTFLKSLRPMKEGLVYFPSFEIPTFIPRSSTYQILRSPEIPINVKAVEDVFSVDIQESNQWEAFYRDPEPIKIVGNMTISENDLFPLEWNFMPLAYLLGTTFVFMQTPLSRLKKIVRKRRERITGKKLLKTAAHTQFTEGERIQILEKALLLRLKEVKQIQNHVQSYRGLQKEGVVGEVRQFCRELEKNRFSRKGKLVFVKEKERAEDLFKRLRGS